VNAYLVYCRYKLRGYTSTADRYPKSLDRESWLCHPFEEELIDSVFEQTPDSSANVANVITGSIVPIKDRIN